MIIQWYPGHMAKARRMLVENLKLIDVVVELVDARAPIATRNPDFDDLFAAKKRVLLFNKSDLASRESTKRFVERYCAMGIPALGFSATDASGRKAAIRLIEDAAREKVVRIREKGVIKTVRAMVVGIPNVGKSTFINRIAGGAPTRVGDKPGVTKGKQWVKISPYLEFLDTPGLLWPKLDDETYARRLAYLGSIKDDIMDVERLAGHLIEELMELCPEELTARYKALTPDLRAEDYLEAMCQSRGFIVQGGEMDLERAARVVLDEFRAGKIARVTLDKVDAPERSDTV